jgi:hypothetical protein
LIRVRLGITSCSTPHASISSQQPSQSSLFYPIGSALQAPTKQNCLFQTYWKKAVHVHVFPDLNSHALLSIGTFCDAGCTATFSATKVHKEKQGKIILTGTRELPGLWKTTEKMLETATTAPEQANSVITASITTNAIKFLHAACFSPTTATWTQAIDRGHFKSWPVPPSNTIRKLLPKSMATAMGHLDQQRKNYRSTKKQKVPKTTDSEGWITPA